MNTSQVDTRHLYRNLQEREIKNIPHLEKEEIETIEKEFLENGQITKYTLRIGEKIPLDINFLDIESLTENIFKIGLHGGSLVAWFKEEKKYKGNIHPLTILKVNKSMDRTCVEINKDIENFETIHEYAKEIEMYLSEENIRKLHMRAMKEKRQGFIVDQLDKKKRRIKQIDTKE